MSATFGIEAIGNDTPQKYTIVKVENGEKKYLAQNNLAEPKTVGKWKFDTANTYAGVLAKQGTYVGDIWLDWPTASLPMRTPMTMRHRDSLAGSVFRALA